MRVKKIIQKVLFPAVIFCLMAGGCLWAGRPVYGRKVISVKINQGNFPDKYFRMFVKKYFDSDGDGILSVREIEKTTSINLRKDFPGTSLKGIEHFSRLKSFTLHEDYWDPEKKESLSFHVEEIDLSANSGLKEVKIAARSLKSLKLSSSASLEVLYLAGPVDCPDLTAQSGLKELILSCNLSSLDLSENRELVTVNLSGNALKSLKIGSGKLTSLNCRDNQLQKLDLAAPENLTDLVCDCNELTTLDLSGMQSLESLYCGQNKLTGLDLTDAGSLKNLSCYNNEIGELDLSACSGLESLVADGMKLESLDLSKAEGLKELSCGGNAVTGLDLSHNKDLEKLIINGNKLEELDLTANEKLVYFNVSHNALTGLKWGKLPLLTGLNVNGNLLEELDLSGLETCRNVECAGNSLKELTTGKEVVYLDCRDNELGSLDVKASAGLRVLFCGNNYLTSLDLTSNTQLESPDCDETVTVQR